MNPVLYEPPCLSLDSDQMLFTTAPYTHGSPLSRCTTTTDGPRPQFLLPSSALLLVGICTAGPTPQMNLPGLAGERNAVKVVSPMPLVRCRPGRATGSRSPAGSCA